MIYLVGTNVFTFNNGPEFSQFERLKAFNDNGIPARLLLMQYSANLPYNLKQHGIDPHHVINMYDYFQGVAGKTGKPVSIHELPDFDYAHYHVKAVDADHSDITYLGKQYGTFHIAPSSVGMIGDEEYFNADSQPGTKLIWDRRGFLSRIDFYHLDGQLGNSQFLRPDGSPALLITRMNKGGQVQPTMWKLFNYRGRDRVFSSELALYEFFLNELNRQEPGAFIVDRPNMEEAVFQIKDALKIAYVHDVPVRYPGQLMTSPVDKWRERTFDTNHNQPVHFDHLVFPTVEEKSQFERRFSQSLKTTKFEAVNDCYVTPVNAIHSFDRQKPILVFRGMLDNTRGLADLAQAFIEIHQAIPGAILKLQGFIGEDKDLQKVTKLMQAKGIADKVILVNYSPANDLSILDDAAIFINATQVEGFGMNMLESMSRAVPVVSYDGIYFRGNLIRHGRNGWMTTDRNPQSLAISALKVLKDPRRYRRLATAALKTAHQFSEARMIDQWRQVLK